MAAYICYSGPIRCLFEYNIIIDLCEAILFNYIYCLNDLSILTEHNNGNRRES